MLPTSPLGRAVFVCCLGLLLLVGLSVGFATTSTTPYCLSCHEMERHAFELKHSSHAVDKDKRPVDCRDCHIPHEVGVRYVLVKSVLGPKDLLAHYLTDVSDLDRRRMQEVGRRYVPDENCLKCHEDLDKDLKGRPISKEGKVAHDAYRDKNGNTMRFCAGCHQNMAHLPRFDARYEVNAKFAAKLAKADAEMEAVKHYGGSKR